MDKVLADAHVEEAFTAGKDLARCAEKLEAAVVGEDRATAVSAMLSLSILMQAPDITEEQLQHVVWELSRVTCKLLTGTDTPIVAKVTH